MKRKALKRKAFSPGKMTQALENVFAEPTAQWTTMDGNFS
jgi:hypothetical protein